jgi:Zn2+/Cd2+-exporting ATPase
MQVPLDGTIVYGEAQVSMQHITGEAMPSRQAKGSNVPAGAPLG